MTCPRSLLLRAISNKSASLRPGSPIVASTSQPEIGIQLGRAASGIQSGPVSLPHKTQSEKVEDVSLPPPLIPSDQSSTGTQTVLLSALPQQQHTPGAVALPIPSSHEPTTEESLVDVSPTSTSHRLSQPISPSLPLSPPQISPVLVSGLDWSPSHPRVRTRQVLSL